MKTHWLSGTRTSLLFLLSAVTAIHGQNVISLPGLYNTGVMDSNLVLTPTAPELHYRVSGAATVAYVVPPVYNPSLGWAWADAPAGAAWIGPNATTNTVSPDPVGVYHYTLEFDLLGYDPSQVQIAGSWMSDNTAELYLNGVFTGFTKNNYGYNHLDAFVLHSGFIPGTNVLEFRVTNEAGDPNPSGLLVSGLTATIESNSPSCFEAPSGLVAWWKAEDAVNDSAGANIAQLSGATFVTGKVGQAFSFDGSGQKVTVPDYDALKLTNSLTIEGWVLANGPGFLLFRGDSRPQLDPYSLTVETTGNLQFLLTSTSNEQIAILAPFVQGQWKHVAATLDGSSGAMKLYIDGVVVAETNTSIRPLRDLDANYGAGVGIGGHSGTYGYFPFNGLIDEISVYDRALSSVEVGAIFAAGSLGKCLAEPPPITSVEPPEGLVSWWRGEADMTDSVGPNPGIAANPPNYVTGKVGAAFEMNGVDQFVRLSNSPSLNPQGSFSIEGWIYPRVDGMRHIMAKWGDTGGFENQRSYTFPTMSGGRLRFAISDAAHQWDIPFHEFDTPPNVLTLNAWNHVAAVYDQSTGTRRIFVNGVQVAERTDAPITVLASTIDAAIGTALLSNTSTVGTFDGMIDELSFYNRALGSNELASIYAAGSAGKTITPTAPVIVSQPASVNAYAGEQVSFSVTAAGTGPFRYLWLHDQNVVVGETNRVLSIAAVQATNAGTYSVLVSNIVGGVMSSNAVLTVNDAPSCVTPPAGLISWWRAEGNGLDEVGGNSGTLSGDATYAASKVGQGFVFDGGGDRLLLQQTESLQLQDFTIEGWIRRSSTSVVSESFPDAEFLSFGHGGFGFGMWWNGQLFLTKIDSGNVNSVGTITDTQFHHVAVTKTNSTVVFYIDGVSNSSALYDPGFVFTTPAAIGGRGEYSWNSFLGQIDEIAVYGRALNPQEIQSIYAASSAGKCPGTYAPFIAGQPNSKTANIGANVTFTVAAGGTAPLSYQWLFNGTNSVGTNSPSLTLPNVQLAQAGVYSVIVSNALGTAVSSNAVLTVVPGPTAIRLVSTSSDGHATVEVPVMVTANGSENGFGFSLGFSRSYLQYAGAVVGSGAQGASLLVNTNSADAGRIGIGLLLPPGTTLQAGTQELVRVLFNVAIVNFSTSSQITFSDVPLTRQVSSPSGEVLTATYIGGSVTLTPSDLEGDLLPRPAGNRLVNISDWVQAGRYAARLDFPTNSSEFQRADSAPRSTQGNGLISVADWVQTGRFAIGLDPLSPAGGPTGAVTRTISALSAMPAKAGLGESRRVQLAETMLFQGQDGNLIVTIDAKGDENAIGFSVVFDPSVVTFKGASLASGASAATMHLNTDLLTEGKLGVVLALPTGQQFGSGIRQLVKMQFHAAESAGSALSVAFSDTPVQCEVASVQAEALAATYATSSVAVNPLPVLTARQTDDGLVLTWPAWAAGFDVERSGTGVSDWKSITGLMETNGAEITITVPADESAEFFRLRQR